MIIKTLEYNLILGSLVMFFLGFIMGFSPCILGIATSIVTLAKNFPQREVQVTMGMISGIAFALTFVIFGGILAYFGQATLQLVGFGEKFMGFIFLFLGLYVLGIRPGKLIWSKFSSPKLRSPVKLTGFYSNVKWSGKHGIYLKGAGLASIFALIPQPHTTPALLAVITYMSTREELLPGIILLLAYGLGNGVIFILSGLFISKLSRLVDYNRNYYINWFLGFVLLVFSGIFILK